MSTPEGRVKAKLNRRLKPLVDARQIHKLMPVQTGFGVVGLDYHICAGGMYVCIETKAPGGGHKVTTRQIETIEHVCAAGGHVFIVYDDESMERALSYIHTCVALAGLKQKFDVAA